MIKSEIRAGTHKKERSIHRREMDAQRSMHARSKNKMAEAGCFLLDLVLADDILRV